MKLNRILFLPIFVFNLLLNARAQVPPQYITDSLQGILDAARVGRAGEGVVMGIHVPGKWSWYGASGSALADVNLTWEVTSYATPTTKYRVGSISKVFTAIAIVKLIEEGLLDLEDALMPYLRPSFLQDTVPNGMSVKIKHLLNHTSGIPSAGDNDSCNSHAIDNLLSTYTMEEAVFCATRGQVEKGPAGDQFFYSNTNYTLLAMVIESLTGQTYEDYISDIIISPLGLTNTEFPIDTIQDPHMGCYWWYNQSTLFNLTNVNVSLYRGWASVVSTTSDMNSFYEQMDNGAIISESSWEMMKAIQPPAWTYGYGLEIKMIDNNNYIGHLGEVGNTSGWFFMDTNLPTAPNGYYISYNFNYQGMNYMHFIDSPVYGLLKGYSASERKDKDEMLLSKVFPVPATNKLYIELDLNKMSRIQLSVCDLTSKTILAESYNAISGYNRLAIDVSLLKNGIYIYKLASKTDITTGRFTITR